MRRTLWIALVVFLVATSTVVGYEVGLRTGRREGFNLASNNDGVVDGVRVTDALRALRRGDIDSAKNHLEWLLDVSIVQVWMASRSSPKVERENDDALVDELKRIADYRQALPREDDDPAKPAVDWLLARYGTPSQAQH